MNEYAFFECIPTCHDKSKMIRSGSSPEPVQLKQDAVQLSVPELEKKKV